jgi:5-methyltetrahydropteroyltriglutamate--homocysteine methyltransferase
MKPADAGSPLFPAGVVGSLPRPIWVQQLHDPSTMDFAGTSRERLLDTAVASALALQEAAGLDVVTDGEWRRKHYTGVITETVDGVVPDPADGRVGSRGKVVRRLRRTATEVAAREVAFVRPLTSKTVKVALPSPYLLAQRMWSPELSKEAYASREAFMEALVPILSEEVAAAEAAGADIVQIDDTELGSFVDAGRRREPGWTRTAEHAVDCVNGVLAAAHSARTAVHLCRGNSKRGWRSEGGYDPLVGLMGRLVADQLVLEFAMPVAGGLRFLSDLPPRFLIGVGCVDCRRPRIDSVGDICAVVDEALRYIDAARISLNPDCGFAPGSHQDIPLDEVYRKLRNEALAAARLRATQGARVASGGRR